MQYYAQMQQLQRISQAAQAQAQALEAHAQAQTRVQAQGQLPTQMTQPAQHPAMPTNDAASSK